MTPHLDMHHALRPSCLAGPGRITILPGISWGTFRDHDQDKPACQWPCFR